MRPTHLENFDVIVIGIHPLSTKVAAILKKKCGKGWGEAIEKIENHAYSLSRNFIYL